MPIFLHPLARYFQFRGRSQRSEFWWFMLFYVTVTVGSGLIGSYWLQVARSQEEIGLAIAANVVGLVLVIPSISVAVRRLHDIDRSGWWFLMNFVPVGGIVLLIWYCRPGTVEANRFGPPEQPHDAVQPADL